MDMQPSFITYRFFGIDYVAFEVKKTSWYHAYRKGWIPSG